MSLSKNKIIYLSIYINLFLCDIVQSSIWWIILSRCFPDTSIICLNIVSKCLMFVMLIDQINKFLGCEYWLLASMLWIINMMTRWEGNLSVNRECGFYGLWTINVILLSCEPVKIFLCELWRFVKIMNIFNFLMNMWTINDKTSDNFPLTSKIVVQPKSWKCQSTIHGLNSLTYVAAKRWNSLPEHIKGAETVGQFQSFIDNHLL